MVISVVYALANFYAVSFHKLPQPSIRLSSPLHALTPVYALANF